MTVATALPTEPQPLPSTAFNLLLAFTLSTRIMFINRDVKGPLQLNDRHIKAAQEKILVQIVKRVGAALLKSGKPWEQKFPQ